MSMFSQKIFKFIALIFIVFITLVCLTTSLNVSSLEFVTPDDSGNIKVSTPKTNLTVAGNQLDIESKTSKDLIAAGSNVTITGDVERNLIASAGNLNIQSKNVGASVRVAGGNISLKNTIIEEDLIVAGGMLSLSNVQVKGDLYFAGGTLDITNSKILGNAAVRYGTYKGDNLDNMVTGNFNAAQNTKLKDEDKSYNKSIWYIFWPGHLGALYGLIILLLFLHNKKALNRFEDIRWNKKFWIDMLIGFAFLVLTPFVFVLSILIFGFTLTGSLWTLIYSILFLSTAFLPFYLAKLIINSSKDKSSVVVTSLVIWFALIIDAMLSNIFPILWIISCLAFLINLSAFGYIINHIISFINKYFEPKKAIDLEPFEP
jgi:hypothetical protein